jgi:hypothetical protein
MIILNINFLRLVITRPFKAKIINLFKIIAELCGILSLAYSYMANKFYNENIDQT